MENYKELIIPVCLIVGAFCIILSVLIHPTLIGLLGVILLGTAIYHLTKKPVEMPADIKEK